MAKAKRKLTLTVDADTVERARKQDINISALTERILQTVTVDNGSLTPAEERREYLRLLSAMDSVISAHQVKVPVAKAYRCLDPSDDYSDVAETELLYVGGGRFEPTSPQALGLDLSDDDWSRPLDRIEDKDTNVDFEPPLRIITNFIEKVSERRQHREAALHELRMVRSVLEAVLNTERADPSTEAEPSAKPTTTTAARRGSKGSRP